jgi:hypothetical protein
MYTNMNVNMNMKTENEHGHFLEIFFISYRISLMFIFFDFRQYLNFDVRYDSISDLDLHSIKMFSNIYWYTRIRISPKFFSVT